MPAFNQPQLLHNLQQQTETFFNQLPRNGNCYLQLPCSTGKVQNKGVRRVTSLSPFLKLSLGDTFQFFIANYLRHVLQAEKAAMRL